MSMKWTVSAVGSDRYCKNCGLEEPIDGKEEVLDGFAGDPPRKGHHEDAIRLEHRGFLPRIGEGIRRRKDRAFSRRIVRGCTSQFNPFNAHEQPATQCRLCFSRGSTYRGNLHFHVCDCAPFSSARWKQRRKRQRKAAAGGKARWSWRALLLLLCATARRTMQTRSTKAKRTTKRTRTPSSFRDCPFAFVAIMFTASSNLRPALAAAYARPVLHTNNRAQYLEQAKFQDELSDWLKDRAHIVDLTLGEDEHAHSYYDVFKEFEDFVEERVAGFIKSEGLHNHQCFVERCGRILEHDDFPSIYLNSIIMAGSYESFAAMFKDSWRAILGDIELASGAEQSGDGGGSSAKK